MCTRAKVTRIGFNPIKDRLEVTRGGKIVTGKRVISPDVT